MDGGLENYVPFQTFHVSFAGEYVIVVWGWAYCFFNEYVDIDLP